MGDAEIDGGELESIAKFKQIHRVCLFCDDEELTIYQWLRLIRDRGNFSEGRDMKISPVFGQARARREACLTDLDSPWRDNFSMRVRMDLRFLYCLAAA